MKIKKPKLKIPVIMLFGIDIVKNFLFLILFMVLSLTFLGTMAGPAIKYFKKQKYEYLTQKQMYELEDLKNKKAIKEYNKQRIENAKILLAFNRDFNKKSFINFSKKEFQNIKLDDKNISLYKKDFIKKSYLLNAEIESPTNLFSFLTKLDNYKNIIEIKLPITLTAKNGKISVLFEFNHLKNRK